jgi:hypothetical protein
MKRLSSFLVVVMAGLAVPATGSGAASTNGQALHCGPAHFSADIRQGPDQDLSLAGSLSITLAGSGRVDGKLAHYGKQLNVTGKWHKRSLKLVVHLRSGRSMTGIGTASRTIGSCADIPNAGTATGPRSGDTGVWGYALGG